ncbi:phytoene/squalene synthase family protein [uncultured Flavobacterium sp.]|uniref:phytoene/squalene synthase family protein n=1 Tax=uncultured Flavobacterium sp. TaxID=165435 RepID=UPI0025D6A7F6|nr:phytoene/squalene synthase family protein [uncultured Flavobacterium sp.]
MKKLFDELSLSVSRQATIKYSTSFSLGIKALSPSLRPAIYSIYGYVRLADEIVDSFHGYNRKRLLERLKSQTAEALEEGIALNPILNSFQQAVSFYGIGHELIRQFLHSMEMDLDPVNYDDALYEEYILGSAEVVGLMCLHVFVEGDKAAYERLRPYAMKLGAAFQKVNFLRDLNDDYQRLGRTYFPGIEVSIFNDEAKNKIEEDVEADFMAALEGIRLLPTSSRFGVYLAYRYYYGLFRKIKALPAKRIMTGRIRIPNGRKLGLMMASYLRYKLAGV